MRYNINFSIAGLVNYIILFLILNFHFKNRSNKVKQAGRMMVALFLADAFDIITALTISYAASVPVWLNYGLNIIYFELELICMALLPVYIRYVIDDDAKISRIWNYFNICILSLYGLICISSPWTHLVFYFDYNGNFFRGPVYWIEYVMPMFLFVYSLVTLIRNRNRFTNTQFFAITSFVILCIIGSVAQGFVIESVLIAYYIDSVAGFLAVIGLETPDFKILTQTLSELEESKQLLEIAKKREEENTKAIHQITRSASWHLYFDKKFNITGGDWSDEFFWMLGYEKDELDEAKIMSLWQDSLHPDDATKTLMAFQGGITGEAAFDNVYRLRHKDGEYSWYRGSGELVPDFIGDGFVYQGIIRDITDEKIKEDLANEKLAVIEELKRSQEALKEALVKAESADRAKSNFLASMSHEIRTPINAVLGMNELISRESTEPSIVEYSASVADAGQSLLALINDILDFSKIEAGRMELVPCEYELSGLLREVYNMINIRCQDRNLDFIVSCDENTPNRLWGDEVRIRQILINFLTNAVKYTDKGSVTLEVSYETVSKYDISLIMSVKDTGIGIKPEDIDNLFDSFKRVDMEHNRKREGTGLGLNITKSFVELMGGNIKVSSVYGEGSVFTVTIPQKAMSSETIGKPEISKANKRKKYEASFNADEAEILVVDDVATNLMVIKGLLKQTGVKIDAVKSGEECLEYIKNKKYDVIFLDHMMPGMDGVETLKKMTEDASHINAATPVVMLTANAISGVKDEYIGLGFSDYLSKPVVASELEGMLLKYIPKNKIISR